MYIDGMTPRNLLLAAALLIVSPLILCAQNVAPASVNSNVPTTRILAIGHLTAGTTRAAVLPLMKQEVPDTVRLYLAGKLDQWYSRKDQNGVVFILNCATVEEAHALLEKLPLGQAKLMEFDLIPLGPLSPLNFLLPEGSPATK
jgi:hypothetical protein